jgi:hypothetical protein
MTLALLSDSEILNRIQDMAAEDMASSSLPGVGDLDIPVVLPNLGYKRMLWLVSGDSLEIGDLFSGVIGGIRDMTSTIQGGIEKFGKGN